MSGMVTVVKAVKTGAGVAMDAARIITTAGELIYAAQALNGAYAEHKRKKVKKNEG